MMTSICIIAHIAVLPPLPALQPAHGTYTTGYYIYLCINNNSYNHENEPQKIILNRERYKYA